ncbi:hypothetical protein AMTR_s00103p00023940 [Amborella trichopoda]|uniref:Uncharacterized protein n=1 Tax=Amborella trichopoda TaxID=13333 RepID=W1NYT1_AMBTC|nr:hypothetical protein AMTR_s00103p00023940 [Amborella trichopoda]
MRHRVHDLLTAMVTAEGPVDYNPHGESNAVRLVQTYMRIREKLRIKIAGAPLLETQSKMPPTYKMWWIHYEEAVGREGGRVAKVAPLHGGLCILIP